MHADTTAPIRPRFLVCYLLSILLFNLAACSSMQTVSIESAMEYSPPRGIDYGSLVRVKMLDKREATFRVTEIETQGLGGKPGFFPYQEMESLEVENPDRNNTDWATVLLALAGIAGLILLIDNADSVRVCSGAPCPEPNP